MSNSAVDSQRVILRPTTEADLEDLLGLWNDGRVMGWVGFPDGLGYGRAQMVEWFAWLQASPDRQHFIASAPGFDFCGELYYSVDRLHRRAALDIKFIPEAQGRGLATAALQQLIGLVFGRELDVDVVWTEPSEENSAARKLYARCGLQPCARPADLGPFSPYWERRRGNDG